MKSFERRTQVAKAIQRELATIIQSGGLKDDRISPLISIVSVELNPSLSSAKVVYSMLSNEPEDELAIASAQAGLIEHAGYARGVIGRRLNLRYAPKLYFTPSSALRKSVDLIHLIEEVVVDDQSAHGGV
jgi:ribosome-binding factor A